MKNVILIFSVFVLFSCNNEIVEPVMSNTEKLCKTWQVVSIGSDDIDYVFIITFYSEGIYDVLFGSIDNHELYHGSWSWCNLAENKFSFSLEGNTDCESNNVFNEIEFSSESFSGLSFETGMQERIVMKLVK